MAGKQDNGAEKPERLTPTKDAIRELFAKSGNLCAFPGCNHLMVNKDGNFIGQICHIEAAESGGERFNDKMTNEERRHVRNLTLMCYAHHVVTNNVKEYPVERLREMKAAHEAKFTNLEQRIEKSFVDEASKQIIQGGNSLRKLHHVLDWGLNDEQHAEMVRDFAEFIERLRCLPKPTRTLLLVIAERGKRPRWGGLSRLGYLRVMHRELADAVGRSDEEVSQQVQVLNSHRFADAEKDDENGQWYINLYDLKHNWGVWEDLRTFARKTGTSLHELLVELNFKSLDG